MTVSVLLITHANVGGALLEAATNTLGFCPLTAEILSIPSSCDPDSSIRRAKKKTHELEHGDGVLILTDIYGSTPSNIACALSNEENVRIISGINLPMLIRVLNYPNLALDELVLKAVSGGKEGIMDCISHVLD
ncbi:MAG TPA: PTS fructose transporter subunit IIA [Gammaproteobacteria bacterium]|nr:PTS fructose transporter subunit IIA [Gammaproteobacteria bacterium]